MAGNKIDSSDPNHSLDTSKNYTKVQFQQGRPILDVDLNDLSATLESQSRSALIEKMGYGPAQLDYREWAVTAVDTNTPLSDRNKDNFSFSLGRLDTHLGVIDTNTYKGDGLASSIIFDTAKVIAEAGSSLATDREFANYILKGTVTSVQSSNGATTLTDANKNFNNLNLPTYSVDTTIDSDYTSLRSQVNYNITDTTSPCAVRITEGACRIYFTTGANAGSSTDINQAGGDYIKFADLANPVSVGDQYVIIPPNTLTQYRTLYNATANKSSSQSTGLSKLPKLMTYVQVFENDVNSTEDADIESSALGFETTHRTQLRWCVRVALVYESIDGDILNSTALTTVKVQHIFKQLSEAGHVEYQTLLDSVDDRASLNNGYLQATFVRDVTSAGVFNKFTLDNQVSPYNDSANLSPMHFFSAQESNRQNLMWHFLKSIMVKRVHTASNVDVQILNLFHSESKSVNANANLETLSEYFFPGMYTDFTSSPFVHAWLSTANNYNRSTGSDTANVDAPSYLTPPRLMMTQADMSTDIMQSRTLFGLDNDILIDGVAPLVFPSMNSHMSFVDQFLLGQTGLGRSIGDSSSGNYIPSYMNHQIYSTNSEITQAGYGNGALKMVDILNDANPSYYLRERGNLSSHQVSKDDEYYGWSFYHKEGDSLDNNDTTDASIRQWNEGIGQTLAIRDSINFRKLAIKTTAHKSMDLFTISPKPLGINHDELFPSSLITTYINDTITTNNNTSNMPIMLPFKGGNSNLDTQNAFNDSYGGLGFHKLLGNTYYDEFSTNYYIPAYNNVAAKGKFEIKQLIEDYVPNDKGISTYADAHTNLDNDSDSNQTRESLFFGPWNRFALTTEDWADVRSVNKLRVPMDLWSNRCTAMRLRYHIGDFYPNGTDSRGVPRNLLVDNLNLFVRIEPLSLAHWMTMPKHQHSVLENSLVLADGIEALLKVSHGLGDTQKLLNASGQPLIQENSPYKTEEVFDSSTVNTFDTRDNVNVGDVDPKDLPFGYQHQPFVHWYHPAQENIRSNFDQSATDKYTLYPKFGRRSLIIPAITPNSFYNGSSYALDDNLNYSNLDDGASASDVGAINMGNAALQAGADFTDSTPIADRELLSYAVHGTQPLVGNNNPTSVSGITFSIPNRVGGTVPGTDNSIVFPFVPLTENQTSDVHLERPTPVFLPANRFYFKQLTRMVTSQDASGTSNTPKIGFHPVIDHYSSYVNWRLDAKEDSYVPYSEQSVYWLKEKNVLNVNALPEFLREEFDVWSVPVMRSAIRTTTVAGIVDLVRTSFDTGALDVNQGNSLLNDYNFTMPSETYVASNSTGGRRQVPAIGPDLASDTLFVGDTGTALSQLYQRTGFMSPLTMGMGSVTAYGQLVHNNNTSSDILRDSFDVHKFYTANTDPLLKCFTSLSNMGLQIKLLMNSSLRILHTRPSGGENNAQDYLYAPRAPKSLTEVFIAHDRINNMTPVELPTPDAPNRKPFIHLASMNRSVTGASQHPNHDSLKHLYGMVSDTTGAPHKILDNSDLDLETRTSVSTSELISSTNAEGRLDMEKEMNQRTAIGDTFTVDPFDYALHSAMLSSNSSIKGAENTQMNSGIEIDLIRELNMIHNDPANYNMNTAVDYNNNAIRLIDQVPTAAELTLPGDHEIVFVLYTGHYGANMYTATNTTQDLTHVPPVAGCHVTATIEVNRPSDRISSSTTDEHHYGQVMDSEPLRTYSILSTK